MCVGFNDRTRDSVMKGHFNMSGDILFKDGWIVQCDDSHYPSVHPFNHRYRILTYLLHTEWKRLLNNRYGSLLSERSEELSRLSRTDFIRISKKICDLGYPENATFGELKFIK